MKWHYLIVSVCLTILVCARALDGNMGQALILGAISVAYLWGFYKSAVARRNLRTAVIKTEAEHTEEKTVASKFRPGRDQLQTYLSLNERASKHWLFLALSAGICGLMGYLVLHYPPLSLVMIFIGIYCTMRYRSTRHMLKKARAALENFE